MVRGTVLIIDDDRGVRDALHFAFIRRNWEAAMSDTEAGGLALLNDCDPDWIIASWDQLGGTGSRFMREVRARTGKTRVLLITESGSRGSRLAACARPDLLLGREVNAEDIYKACEGFTPVETPVVAGASSEDAGRRTLPHLA
jgi:ActR/RegA family two-component response regulator